MSGNDWRIKHREVIVSFLEYLNMITGNFILKGGTALFLCYHLDRFSEDIDLDGREKGLVELVNGFCAERGYSFRVAKATDTVERCFVNYGNDGHPSAQDRGFVQAHGNPAGGNSDNQWY